ncbi:MAG: GspMb/PilO family protein [Planctomycetota bacterium]|jgi:hypothetical protein
MRPNLKKNLVTVAVTWMAFFVAACVVYITVLAPQAELRERLAEEYATKQRRYESARIAAQEETKIRLKEQIQHLRDRLKNFVVDFDDTTNLTFDVSQIAGETGVAAFSINRRDDHTKSAIPDCEHIREECMTVRFSAEFNQFFALLNALERHRPVLFVDDFVIRRSTSGGSDHPVNMELAVFVVKPAAGGTTDAI